MGVGAEALSTADAVATVFQADLLYHKETLHWAGIYSANGLNMFPLVSTRLEGDDSIDCRCRRTGQCDGSGTDGNGRGCFHNGKHPAIKGWPKAATTWPERIEEWVAQSPGGNLAILTGKASRLLTLDIDPRNGGDESLERLQREYGDLPGGGVTVTGGGGNHYFFRTSEEFKTRPLPGFPGIDIKSKGGFVVAPPSIHKSGKRYEWANGNGPSQIPDAPKWLLDLLTEEEKPKERKPEQKAPKENPGIQSKTRRKTPAVVRGPVFPKGKRLSGLLSFGGQVMAWGAGPAVVHDCLEVLNRHCCSPPHTPERIAEIAASCAGFKPGVRKARLMSAVFSPGLCWSESSKAARTEKLVLLCLISHADLNTWQCWPSASTIAKEAGCSKSTVHRALRRLRDSGYLIWDRGRKGQSNQYTVHIAQILDDAAKPGGESDGCAEGTSP